MQTKHLTAIANILRHWDEATGKNNLIESLIDYMRFENCEFNAEKFREACKLPSKPQKTRRVLTCKNYPKLERNWQFSTDREDE